MVCFQTKNRNLGKIFRVSDWKMLINLLYDHLEYFMTILEYFMTIWDIIWDIFSCFGFMHQERSGNPGWAFSGQSWGAKHLDFEK
jgi:hypothetical protein